MAERVIKPNPSQSKMILSDKPVVVLIGPKGEGKTYGAVGAILYHASRFPYKVRGAVIRDRFTTIQKNTIPSIMRVAGDIITFHRDGAFMRGPNFEADLFGVDDLADISVLQGSEYYFVWIEEPAPVFEVGSAGLREEVFDLCYARGGREEGAIDKVLVTMNPASKSHWTYKRFILNPDPEFDVIRIPYGENPHIPDKERAKTKRAFKDKPELYSRYVKGEFASVNLGECVTPEYSDLIHRSRVALEPYENSLMFRFWDGGLWPTCVFFQIAPNGQFLVFKTLRGENIGMKQLLENEVKPYIATRFFKNREWRDIGDPSLCDADQMDSTRSVSQVIDASLDTYFETGTMSWENRRESLKEALNMSVDGEPKLLISSEDDIMQESLGGGWHYKVNSAGMIVNDKPVKDKHSHPGDALSHGLAAILHPESIEKRKRFNSYSTAFDPFADERRVNLQAEENWNPYQS